MPDAVAAFEYDRPYPALQQMGGSGKANRTGTDDGNRLCFAHGILPLN